MDIQSLFHLGCAKIATLIKTLIKTKSPEELKKILADQQNRFKNASAGVRATIASYVAEDTRGARDMCILMGLTGWVPCTHCDLAKLNQRVSDLTKESASARKTLTMTRSDEDFAKAKECANRLAQAEESLDNAEDAGCHVCKGMVEVTEGERYLHMFAEGPQQWNKFDDTDKSPVIELSKDQKIAAGITGTVRAGPWVPRDGYATGTVRVLEAARLQIGIITKDYADSLKNQPGFNPQHGPWMANMDTNPQACYFYRNSWDETPRGEILGESQQFVPAASNISNGSVVTVTLKGGNVTFTNDGIELKTIPIPKGWGPISLAVSLFGGTEVEGIFEPATVTLL